MFLIPLPLPPHHPPPPSPPPPLPPPPPSDKAKLPDSDRCSACDTGGGGEGIQWHEGKGLNRPTSACLRLLL